MRSRLVPLLLAAALASPAGAVTIDFESLNLGDGLSEINALTVPLGATFDGVTPADPPEVVVDPGDPTGKAVEGGTLPAGADILVVLDAPADTFRVRYPDEASQLDATVAVVAYNHGGTSATIQGTGGVLSAQTGTEPTSFEVLANGIVGVQLELAGNPILVDDVEFLTVCGNGWVGAGETCDDGNTQDGDGCDALCQWEPAPQGQLRNGDFEVSEPIGGMIPTDFGDWDTDVSMIVASAGGLLPFEGTKMLCFDSTGLEVDSGGTGGDVRQFVDVSHLAMEIEAAELTASARVHVNRSASKGGQQDSEFLLGIYAHDGSPATFADSADALAFETVSLVSDADPGTWEELTVELEVPPDTTYLEIVLSAIENVFDDATRPAFEGLCADGATLVLDGAPPPSCGDGILDSGEECDDGNTAVGDGCDGMCLIEGVDGECGDGNVDPGEQCDDGNTVAADGCDASCREEEPDGLCTPDPRDDCIAAAKAILSISEKKVGKEKWKASLKGLGEETSAASLGDPVDGTTEVVACLYDGAGASAASITIDRAGQSCGQKPCWKAQKDKGWSYKDPSSSADGARKLKFKAGPASKGKLQLQAGNNAKKGQTGLPTEVTPGLADETAVRLQIVVSDGACFDATLGVKKADAAQLKAKAP